MMMPIAADLIESMAVALAGGPEEWLCYSAVIQNQYRMVAARAAAHLMGVGAVMATAG